MSRGAHCLSLAAGMVAAVTTTALFTLALCGVSGAVWAQDEPPPELCNGLDDDEDGLIDEDFDVGAQCNVVSGPCATGGVKVCTGDGSGTECQADGPLIMEEPEGPAGSASCFDHLDNDCDDLVDHADPDCTTDEVCNGFDDDNDGSVDEDFLDLGQACTAGIGTCQRSGVRICSGNGLTTTCSAMPGPAGLESPPGSGSCSDGDDNDCDALVDLADPNCREDEKCDGLDNDGDGDVDEDFDLGAPCSDGTGICLANGEKVCLPDGTDTVCNVMALAPQPEGPAGATCTDGLDNDCDELVDGADANCGSAGLAATCALPIVRGEPGASCAGLHRIQMGALNATPTTEVTGELLALDETGATLGSIPVQNGDLAHLLSGLENFKLSSHRGRHQVKAPIPMLRVTVRDGVRQVRAYCSNLPFLDIVEPAGGLGTVVVQGKATSVTVALPRVDPATLVVMLDGVDVLAALGVDPATELPGGPFSGAVVIGGEPVSVSELVVDSAALSVPSSNTLRMLIADLGGGGHIVEVTGDARAGSIPQPGSVHCLEDDLEDDVRIDAFEITIDTPGPGEVVSSVPTQVAGEVRHGRQIASLSINGLAQDVGDQVFEPGPGTGAFVLPIDAAIEQTDLLADIQGLNTSLGTFDPGPNRLVVEARDDLGTQAFATHTFAVGDLIQMASLSSLSSLRARPPSSAAFPEIGPLAIGEGGEVADALVLGLAPEAVQEIFAQFCMRNSDQIIETMTTEAMNLGANPGLTDTLPSEAEVDGACNPSLEYEVCDTCVTFDPDVTPSCSVELADGQLTAFVTLPDMFIDMHVTGGCSTFLWHKIKVDTDVKVTATGITGMLTLEEADFLVDEIMKDIHIEIANIEAEKDDHTTFSGVGFGLILEILDFIGKIFTLGYVDDLGFKLQIFLTGLFKDAFSCLDFDCNFGGDGDMGAAFDVPLGDLLDGIGLNGDGFASEMLGFAAQVASVKIDPNGFTASLTAAFAPFTVDPEIPEIPGALETAADAPMPPVDMAQGFFAVSDDVVNQLLASLTAMGDFKSVCLPAGRTVGDFLPPDCATLGDPDPVTGVKPTARLICEALKAESCEAQTDASVRFMCVALRALNISIDTGVLMCGRLEIPPVLLIRDDIDPGGNPVETPAQIETQVRLNDLHVWIILDRNPDIEFVDLEALPTCLSAAQPDVSLDCQFLEICLDLNLATNLSLTMAAEGPSLELVVGAFQDLQGSRDPGYSCNGEVQFIDVQEFLSQALMSDALEEIRFSIAVPALKPEGLDLMGIGQLTQLRLKGIRTSEAMVGFDDYLGLLGDFEVTAEARLAQGTQALCDETPRTTCGGVFGEGLPTTQ